MHSYQIYTKGQALEKAQKALILLHGRGASAQSILSLGEDLGDERFYMAAPQASGNTWYPYSFMAPETQNEPWLSSALETVQRLADETAQYIAPEHIYWAGFSQGACLMSEVLARNPRRYGGAAAFIGGLIGEDLKPERYQGDFWGMPFLIFTGDRDPHVPLSRVKASEEILTRRGARVSLEVVPGMPHTILPGQSAKTRALFGGEA